MGRPPGTLLLDSFGRPRSRQRGPWQSLEPGQVRSASFSAAPAFLAVRGTSSAEMPRKFAGGPPRTAPAGKVRYRNLVQSELQPQQQPPLQQQQQQQRSAPLPLASSGAFGGGAACAASAGPAAARAGERGGSDENARPRTADAGVTHAALAAAALTPQSQQPSATEQAINGSSSSSSGGGGAAAATGHLLPAICRPAAEDTVTIHVCDDVRSVTRDFQCNRALLLQEMQYFQGYLSASAGPFDEVDILVHCDVRIFEWLFRYIHAPRPAADATPRSAASATAPAENSTTCSAAAPYQAGGGSGCCARPAAAAAAAPQLEVANVVSVLISSDFLKMAALVAECLAFVARNFSEVVRLPIDLACLTDAMVGAVARLMTLRELAAARDRRDKLLSRVFKKRLEVEYRDRSGHRAVRCCRHCAALYTERPHGSGSSGGTASSGSGGGDGGALTCVRAPPLVDARGRLVRRHAPARPWSLTALVAALHARGMTWTEVYWLLWGATRTLRCRRCGEAFTASEIGGCRHHPGRAAYAAGACEGRWSCCRAAAARFSLDTAAPGCAVTDHVPENDAPESAEALALLPLQRRSITAEGWREAVAEEAVRAGCAAAAAALPAAAPAVAAATAAAGDDSSCAGTVDRGGAGGGGAADARRAPPLRPGTRKGARRPRTHCGSSAAADGTSAAGGMEGAVPQPPAAGGGGGGACSSGGSSSSAAASAAATPRGGHSLQHIAAAAAAAVAADLEAAQRWAAVEPDAVQARRLRIDAARERDAAGMAALEAALLAQRSRPPPPLPPASEQRQSSGAQPQQQQQQQQRGADASGRPPPARRHSDGGAAALRRDGGGGGSGSAPG